jgi:hypothetical protein
MARVTTIILNLERMKIDLEKRRRDVMFATLWNIGRKNVTWFRMLGDREARHPILVQISLATTSNTVL